MKTAEEILKPYVETIFRHTKVVEDDNAIIAMKRYADQFRGLTLIPTSEQPPPDYRRVLYYDTRGKGAFEVGFFVWSQTPVDYVSHWTELPADPITPAS